MGEFLPGKFPATPLQFNYYIRDLTIVNDDPFSRGVNFCIKNLLENDLPIGIISMRNISSPNKALEIGFTWYVTATLLFLFALSPLAFRLPLLLNPTTNDH